MGMQLCDGSHTLADHRADVHVVVCKLRPKQPHTEGGGGQTANRAPGDPLDPDV
jgi:hypothetical protein